jgi:hypothetical protein
MLFADRNATGLKICCILETCVCGFDRRPLHFCVLIVVLFRLLCSDAFRCAVQQLELEQRWAVLQPIADPRYARHEQASESEAEGELPFLDESIDEVFSFCRAFEKCVFYHASPSRDPRTAEPQLVALVFEMFRRMQSRNVAIRSALSVILQCQQSLTTDVGLVRGFWRQVLNGGNCSSVMVEIFESPEETRTCYKGTSVWTNEELRQRMARACTCLFRG